MLISLEVSGSWTERGTDGSAPWWSTTSQPADGVVDPFVGPQVAFEELDLTLQVVEVGP